MRTYRAWRGLKSLVHDAVSATTNLVGEGNDSTGRTTVRVASLTPLAGPVRVANDVRKLATDGVLATVRGVNRVVEELSDVGLDMGVGTPHGGEPDHAVTMRSDVMTTGAWMGDALIGAVNGVVGDHLHRRGNTLDLGMSFRYRDAEISLDRATLGSLTRATRKVAVWVHGLATTEWSWCLGTARFLGDAASNFGSLLERDLGFPPVFVRYNTGALPWLDVTTRVVCLGTPHQGAPLERFAEVAADALSAIDLPGTRIAAAILRTRSAGIQDLAHGAITHNAEDSGGVDPLGIAYAFIAGSLTADPEHPLSRMLGDLLVQVPSAAGPIVGTFPVQTAHFGGVRHHEMQVHPDVYEQVRKFFAAEWDAG